MEQSRPTKGKYCVTKHFPRRVCNFQQFETFCSLGKCFLKDDNGDYRFKKIKTQKNPKETYRTLSGFLKYSCLNNIKLFESSFGINFHPITTCFGHSLECSSNSPC